MGEPLIFVHLLRHIRHPPPSSSLTSIRLSLWTYVMASVTYMNICVKIIYWFLFEEVFRGPALMSTAGFFYWTGVGLYRNRSPDV